MRVDLARITDLRRLQAEIPACRLCPRLNGWRERIARDKVARFRHWDYWSRPVPSLGKADARLLVVGLAPAAHGANRTGRMLPGTEAGSGFIAPFIDMASPAIPNPPTARIP